MLVSLQRLLDTLSIDIDIWEWSKSDEFTLDEVIAAKYDGVVGDASPFGDTWKHPVKEAKTKDYHIARIIYFMDHPDEIKDVEVDNPCIDGGILPGCAIVDGHHRLAAAIILNLDYIDVNYGGREDVLKYISGEIDICPDEIIGVW